MNGDAVHTERVRPSTWLWVAVLVASAVAYLWVGPSSSGTEVVPAAGTSGGSTVTTVPAGGAGSTTTP